jgi:hypothetical protein
MSASFLIDISQSGAAQGSQKRLGNGEGGVVYQGLKWGHELGGAERSIRWSIVRGCRSVKEEGRRHDSIEKIQRRTVRMWK